MINKLRSSLPALSFPLLVACGGESGVGEHTYPDSESEAAKIYLERCSFCHQAPLPDVHSWDKWSGIVTRMEKQMANKGRGYLADHEREIIVQYLEKHGRRG